MKLIDWNRDYMVLGIFSLCLGLLLLIRNILLGSFFSLWSSLSALFLPLLFFYVCYSFIRTEGPRFTATEAIFLLGILFCGIYYIYSSIKDVIMIPNSLNLIVIIFNVVIVIISWISLFYYSY